MTKNFGMEYPFLSLFAFFGLYTVLFYSRRSLERNPSHSFPLRCIIGIVAWSMTGMAAVYAASMIVLVSEFFSGDAAAGYSVVFQLVILIVVVRLYVYYEESMDLGEMKNFLHDALSFRNYVRRMDYEIREEIDRHEVRRIYKEVTNKELTPDVTATAYDYHSTPLLKDRIPAAKVSQQIHAGNVRNLVEGKHIDGTEAFQLELIGNTAHPYLQLIREVSLDGTSLTLSCGIVLPLEQRIRWEEPNSRQRIIERIYESLAILTSLRWFGIYDRFVRTIVVTVRQTEMGEEVKEEMKEAVRCEISLPKLRARGTKITPAAEVEKIAKITFLT